MKAARTSSFEITSLAEARRAKLALYYGQVSLLKLKGMPIKAVVTAVERQEEGWLVRIIQLSETEARVV